MSDGARLRALVFLVLLALLLLGGRREFFRSDGQVEHRAGEAIFHRGAIDLPPELADGNRRFVIGRDGRSYSIFGIGASVQFAVAVAADRILDRVVGVPSPPGEGQRHRGFFATHANVPVVALTGAVLLTLLLDLGVAAPVAVAAALLGVLGTMNAVYATLSYDMPLANLFLLAGTLFFLRACRGGAPRDGIFAGLLLGAGLLTRVTTAIFLPVFGVHALLEAKRRGRGGAVALARPAAAFAVAIGAALLLLGWYNWRRFGGVLETGYTEELVAARFDTPLLESLPALLLSPGRGILVFSPLLLLALPGIPLLLRARRAEGAALMLMALVNLLFFAKNRNWANAAVAWGPRFQLPTTLLLTVPLAHALGWAWSRRGAASRVLVAALCLLSTAVQAAVLLAGTSAPRPPLWSAGTSQIAQVAGRLAAIVRAGSWRELDLWWLGPWGELGPLRVLFWASLAAAAAGAAGLARTLLRRGGRSRGA